ncbi:YfhJ family protein [Salibacterium halotolerans]|uniref:WVELL protein n=1 Tax=Salibacterium halotolerans TaxID=1884432 RepID=A0A1I5RF45_9BACI|nr:YfhJ family protein [Salibacterium halotolerans]SFP57000.1 WVELL protein [Salibacterium halotolerans]
MGPVFERLTDQLMILNSELGAEQARSWVEHLWEDFETTRAKSGRSYKGPEVTETIVQKWLEQYGPHLHRYEPTNSRFSNLS